MRAGVTMMDTLAFCFFYLCGYNALRYMPSAMK